MSSATMRAGPPRGGYWWTMHVNREVAQRLLPFAIRRRLHPNQVTIANLAVGLMTSALVFLLHPTIPAAATALGVVGWQFAYALDCLDGQLARATGLLSNRGAVLDLLCDYLVQTSVLIVVVPIALRAAPVAWALPTAVVLTTLWLTALFYSAASIQLDRRASSRGLGRVGLAVRHARDYGLVVFMLGSSLALSEIASLGVLVTAAALNLVFVTDRLFRFSARDLEVRQDG